MRFFHFSSFLPFPYCFIILISFYFFTFLSFFVVYSFSLWSICHTAIFRCFMVQNIPIPFYQIHYFYCQMILSDLISIISLKSLDKRKPQYVYKNSVENLMTKQWVNLFIFMSTNMGGRVIFLSVQGVIARERENALSLSVTHINRIANAEQIHVFQPSLSSQFALLKHHTRLRNVSVSYFVNGLYVVGSDPALRIFRG